MPISAQTPSKVRHTIRFAEVARDLADAIASGRFPVGSLLPTEVALCAHYGASRHTVREAMRELEAVGLVSRKKKVGTRVEAAKPSPGFHQSLGSVEDLIQLAATRVRVVQKIDDVVADQALANALGCAPGSRWLHVSELRRNSPMSDVPFCWTDVYVDAAYSELRKVIRKSPDVMISTLLEDRYGRRSVEIRQTIEAVGVSEEMAGPLQTTPSSPALKIQRHYVDLAGEVFLISISIHPADRFTFSTVLRRSRVDTALS